MASSVFAAASLAVIFMAALLAGALAQSSGCTTAIIGLSPCLSYITGNASTPSGSCCSQLASVVGSEPQCLCSVLNGGASQFGIAINQTQALALPGACKVQTPPVSQCSAVAGPADSPTSNPSTPGGSKNTPTTISSDGSSVKASFSLAFFLLYIASYTTTCFSTF